MMIIKKNSLLLSFLSIFLVTACAPVLLGAGVYTVDVLNDRRSAGDLIDDANIELRARKIFISTKELRKSLHINAQSWNGILLLTGEIDDAEVKPKLIEQLSKIEGVRQIVDETNIQSKTTLLNRSNDTWISQKVKSKIAFKRGIDLGEVKVIVTRGVVYLMGIVTEEEAEIATKAASSVKGVLKVVKIFEYVHNNQFINEADPT